MKNTICLKPVKTKHQNTNTKHNTEQTQHLPGVCFPYHGQKWSVSYKVVNEKQFIFEACQNIKTPTQKQQKNITQTEYKTTTTTPWGLFPLRWPTNISFI